MGDGKVQKAPSGLDGAWKVGKFSSCDGTDKTVEKTALLGDIRQAFFGFILPGTDIARQANHEPDAVA
jgi:hypothetical protein